MTSKVSKGAVSSSRSSASSKTRKLGDILRDEKEREADTISYISRKGVDKAWIIPPGPRHDSTSGVYVGMDEGVHLNFEGVGVTKPLRPKTNSRDRKIVERMEAAIKDGLPIIEELGIEVLKPQQPRPPFAKWDATSPSAIKVALSVLFGDDHSANVEMVKAAARYEAANQNREDVMGILDGLLAVEAAESDDFDVEVSVS